MPNSPLRRHDGRIKDTEMATEAVSPQHLGSRRCDEPVAEIVPNTPSQVSIRGARAVLNAPAGVNPMRIGPVRWSRTRRRGAHAAARAPIHQVRV
jgi:hypothetical protein